MTGLLPALRAFFPAMPNRVDLYRLQFHGMEPDELRYARDRSRRAARAQRRVFWRV